MATKTRKSAKASEAAAEKKSAPASKIAAAVAMLKGKAPVHPVDLQNATRMSRRLSHWDMQNLATAEGCKLEVSTSPEWRGKFYRLVPRKSVKKAA